MQAPATATPPNTSTTAESESCSPSAPGKKNKPDEWEPTKDPKKEIIPGEMRSDCEEIPEGFTKEDADKAETMEAATQSAQQQPGLRAASDCEVYWPAPYEVCGAIRDKYNELGGPNSFLLWPTSGELTNPDSVGRRTQFQNGPIYWSPWGGAHPVVNSFLNRWGIHGYEGGWLNYPITDEILLPDGGRRQEFENGAIYVAFQNAVGSAIRNGAIRDKWNTVGGTTPGGSLLGYLIEDEHSLPDGQGAMARFEHGVIYWSPTTDAHPVIGAILDIWDDEGYEQGFFGYPISDQSTSADNWLTQQFQGASIDVESTTFQVENAAGGICVFGMTSDRVHISTGKPGSPRAASAHGWWVPISGCPTDARATVTVQLQTTDPQGVWHDRGSPVVNSSAKPGSGKGRWTAIHSDCIHNGPKTWRIVVDADMVGAEDTPNKHYSTPNEILCS